MSCTYFQNISCMYVYISKKINNGIRNDQYQSIHLDLPSTQRIQTHTSHRHNTTPPLPTLVQAPYPTHTTATKTQTHVQHSPVPRGLVKPKPNSLIHSPPSTSQTHTHVTHSTNTSHKHVTCTRQNT